MNELNFNETSNKILSIEADKEVFIDLNGNTIKGIANSNTTTVFIDNQGHLTIDDSIGGGSIVFDNGGEFVHNNFSATINNGGTLVINGGTIENLMDDQGNSEDKWVPALAVQNIGSKNIKLELNGGTIKSETYRAIRSFANSSNSNDIVINSGTVIGCIWLHMPSTDSDTKASLKINGGTITPFPAYNAAVQIDYIRSSEEKIEEVQADNVDISINGGFISGYIVAFVSPNDNQFQYKQDVYENITLTDGVYKYGFFDNYDQNYIEDEWVIPEKYVNDSKKAQLNDVSGRNYTLYNTMDDARKASSPEDVITELNDHEGLVNEEGKDKQWDYVRLIFKNEKNATEEWQVRVEGESDTLPNPTYEGYEFKGWYCEETGKTLSAGERVKLEKRKGKTDYLTLEAQWEKKQDENPGGDDEKEPIAPPRRPSVTEDKELPKTTAECQKAFGSEYIYSGEVGACIIKQMIIPDTSAK